MRSGCVSPQQQQKQQPGRRQSCHLVYFQEDQLWSQTMSLYDSNPFADPVDVNPFQVRLECGFTASDPSFLWLFSGTVRNNAPRTCLVGLWVWPEIFPELESSRVMNMTCSWPLWIVIRSVDLTFGLSSPAQVKGDLWAGVSWELITCGVSSRPAIDGKQPTMGTTRAFGI